MKYTSIFEKILCLFQILKNSWANLIFLSVVLVLMILMFKKKISKKVCFRLVLIGYLILLAFTCFCQFDQLSLLANSIVDHFFTDLYFPSVYVYLFVFILLNLVTIGGLLKINGDKIYKIIHGICLISMNFIFTLVLNLVADNKIDVFSKTSLFSNTDLVTLLELSVNIFILWVVGLFITYLTNQITARIVITKEDTMLKKDPAIMEPVAAMVDESELKEEYLASNHQNDISPSPIPTNLNEATNLESGSYTYQFIPVFHQNNTNEKANSSFNQQLMFEQAFHQKNSLESNFNENSNIELNASIKNYSNEINTFVPNIDSSYSKISSNKEENSFDLSSFVPKKQVNVFNTQERSNLIFEQILNNKMPLTKEEPKTIPLEEQEKNTYTLNDYRIFNKMLKDIKEHNQSNVIQIDKNLEYRLITKYSNETYLMFKRMLKNYSN